MITIHNKLFSTYDNDIRALVNAFYPGVPLQFSANEDCSTVDVPGSRARTSRKMPKTRERTSREMSESQDRTTREVSETRAPDSQETQILDLDSLAPQVKRAENRFEEKTNLKQVLYRELAARTGRSLPWGTLTGIRPVRILEMLEQQGLTQEETDRQLREKFLISEQKIRLMKDIYRTEQQVLDRIDYRNSCSIYIGIPFCPTRCLYCSFTSNPIDLWANRVDLYLECLKREMLELVSEGEVSAGSVTDGNVADGNVSVGEKGNVRGVPISTVYVGGGTPTALSAAQLDRLLGDMEEIFGVNGKNLAELTVEAGRPDSITEEKLRVLKEHNVGRISINPQTFNQKTLALIGTRHTVEETQQAYGLARRLGFDNINMDLIMGLPGENLEDVERTLAKVRELQPDNLTVHTLAVKRAARLSTEQKAWGGIEHMGSRPDEAEAAEIAKMTELGAECAAGLGMHPYYLYRQKNMAGNQENVGYAVPGKESIYNILMMEEKHSVYGLGAGSSTKRVIMESKKVIRSDHPKNLRDYAAKYGISF